MGALKDVSSPVSSGKFLSQQEPLLLGSGVYRPHSCGHFTIIGGNLPRVPLWDLRDPVC